LALGDPWRERHDNPIQETDMKKTLTVTTLALLFAATAVAAAEPAGGPIKAAAPAKASAVSQQDKMRLCSQQATGKKGQERKTFMKTCLSKKA
jgi:hypothetical protein